MTEDELTKLFSDADNIKPTENARRAAHQAAMAAFAAQSTQQENDQQEKVSPETQGNITTLRPTRENQQNTGRRKIMNTINQRWLVSGLASAAVLVVTVSILFNVTNPVSPATQQKDQAGKRADSHQGTLEEIVVTALRKEERFSLEADSAQPMVLNAPASVAPAPESPARGKTFPAKTQALGKLTGSSIAAPPADNITLPGYQDVGRDDFEQVDQSPVRQVANEPVSTFSIDVDTASYSFIRRQLNQGVLPQKDAVRVEEMLNYFDYDYPLPESRDAPFKATATVSDAPWKPGNKLIHIGIRGYDIPRQQAPSSNLVFLLDVSGSMSSPDKLPLVKQSMGLLLSQLKPTDTVAIVAYAGAAGTVLEPTQVKEKQKILAAMERLNAGGSTAGGEGIKLAYQLAKAGFDKNAVNRVILATDGDFNVGITDRNELQGFVERQRESGIYLSVLGFGQGNYHDHLMQTLAQNGNGVAAYIDTLSEAQKVLVNEATSTLFPIARDVKLQVEFNPATVSEYRLLGYETRALKQEDFNNDKVDAGDIGAGHRVTAIYEITPVGSDSGLHEASRYQTETATPEPAVSGEYGFLKIRYKLPEEQKSKLITATISSDQQLEPGNKLSQEVNFATAVAGFAEILRGGQYAGKWDYQAVIDLANANKGEDPYGYRAEFVQLVRKASVAEAMR